MTRAARQIGSSLGSPLGGDGAVDHHRGRCTSCALEEVNSEISCLVFPKQLPICRSHLAEVVNDESQFGQI